MKTKFFHHTALYFYANQFRDAHLWNDKRYTFICKFEYTKKHNRGASGSMTQTPGVSPVMLGTNNVHNCVNHLDYHTHACTLKTWTMHTLNAYHSFSNYQDTMKINNI